MSALHMSSLSSPGIRFADFVSHPNRWPGRSHPVAAPAAWIAGIVLAALLTAWLTGRVWAAALVGIGGMVLAAWYAVKTLTAARTAAGRAEQDRAAMEQTLRRSQKMEALGRLTAGVAHDFNNHLTVIASNVELLARRLDGRQERLLRHTEAALEGVQRAAALTGRLLSLAHQPVPEPGAVDVDRLLMGLSDMLRRTLGDRIGLEVLPSGEPWFVRADIDQMENAVLSLAVNARDHARTGAKLTIAVSNVLLDQAFQAAYPPAEPGEYIQLAVSDSATDPVDWRFAGESGNDDLSMARAFVRDAGGFLLRSDAAPGGLSLRLFLPRYVLPALAAAGSRRTAGGAATILVVEDDAAVRGACADILRELDYDVLEAPDAMEAFRLIADHGGIDLLFTDIGLPGGVSGRALANAARSADAGIRVLFTTGYDLPGAPDRAGTALLRKPFSPAQLAGMVRDVLAAEPLVQQTRTGPGESAGLFRQ